MDKSIFNIQENCLWILNILLCFLAISLHLEYLGLLFFWMVIILIIGNAKRIHLNKYKYIFMVLRRSMYVIPLFFPLFFFDVKTIVFNFEKVLLWSVISILVGICFVLPKYKQWKLVLSYDFLRYSVGKSKIDYYTMISILIIGAVAEEYFFRYYIINLTGKKFIVINCILSIILFFLHHFTTKWSNDFTNYDFIIQILFGTCSVLLYLVSGTLITSILSHIVYNSPHIIMNYRLLRIQKGK